MSYRFTHVKRRKRGAKWPSGEKRYCLRCRNEKQWGGSGRRVRQATITATMRYSGTKGGGVPVAYCEEHDPIAVPSPSDYAEEE